MARQHQQRRINKSNGISAASGVETWRSLRQSESVIGGARRQRWREP